MSRSPVPFCLRLEEPGKSPRYFSLKPDVPYILGRDPRKSTIVVQDRGVSRRHLRLKADTDCVIVEDLGSSTGTFLSDGTQLSSAEFGIGDGMGILVGSIRVYILDQRQLPIKEAVEPTPSPSPTKKTPPSARSSTTAEDEQTINTSGVKPDTEKSGQRYLQLMRQVHKELLERLDLRRGRELAVSDDELKQQVQQTIEEIVDAVDQTQFPNPEFRRKLIKEVLDEAVGLGPLESALADPAVSEIMVVDREHVYVEKSGRIVKLDTFFTSDDAIKAIIERIVSPLGRRIDEAQPLVDARLKDGSRVNAVIKPLALKGPCITIRKFSKKRITMQDLVTREGASPEMARFLELAVKCKKNIIVSGGTGSGKTTLLNILSSFIDDSERIITVEDAAELQLDQEHVVSLETRPPNLEGRGAFTIRDLVKNALRMRPDRIVVGECRGGEAIDMLQAMNTGHSGSLTTLHANSPQESITRLESMVMMFSGGDLPVLSIRQQIQEAIHVIVQQTRYSDGSRRISHISEVIDTEDSGEVVVRDLYRFRTQAGSQPDHIVGTFKRTGYIPSFYGEFLVNGFVKSGDFL
ncbi:MAG: Flp pilus assembly complex ATPase component TadA [Myxococcales bacterium]|nr:Flp pilus assembly complex ATPase component TadA [Myxococcales bacterium]